MNKIKFSPERWQLMLGINIISPDGWNRNDFAADWRKELTFNEFMDKADGSTVMALYPSRKELISNLKNSLLFESLILEMVQN